MVTPTTSIINSLLPGAGLKRMDLFSGNSMNASGGDNVCSERDDFFFQMEKFHFDDDCHGSYMYAAAAADAYVLW